MLAGSAERHRARRRCERSEFQHSLKIPDRGELETAQRVQGVFRTIWGLDIVELPAPFLVYVSVHNLYKNSRPKQHAFRQGVRG
jgi:hypothetical protein